jgi:hypothetical protein
MTIDARNKNRLSICMIDDPFLWTNNIIDK